jgi:hypothetical protein
MTGARYCAPELMAGGVVATARSPRRTGLIYEGTARPIAPIPGPIRWAQLSSAGSESCRVGVVGLAEEDYLAEWKWQTWVVAVTTACFVSSV